MWSVLTKSSPSQRSGDNSNGSTYPVSEKAYMRRVYGSDHLKQLFDGHQKGAILRYALPWKRAELAACQRRLDHLTCANDPGMTKPGRSAYSLRLLSENLRMYEAPQWRTLRWCSDYHEALGMVASDLLNLVRRQGGPLRPMAIQEVASSDHVLKNLSKNAGYYGFLTGKRSKGENLDSAVKWCVEHEDQIRMSGTYGMPVVISHRSSNSKPLDDRRWKWRCRIVLMQDVRALLMDGRFAIPFIEMFRECPWGEGGMTHEEVRYWIHKARCRNERWYSSDYSRFDVSQPVWLLEDVFDYVVRPCFGVLSDADEQLFHAMRHSYIHKDIHGFDRVYHAHGCQLSGSLTTYAFNTIVNQVIDTTVLLMMGCDPRKMSSLKCGDDNLTFYNGDQPWDAKTHCKLIKRYFGIETTIGDADQGSSKDAAPIFLSRQWDWGGERRDIREVIWNLVYPERFRDYDPKTTGVSVLRAEALLLFAAYLEQPLTMREYFDVSRIREDAGFLQSGSMRQTYEALAGLGSGFYSSKVDWRLQQLRNL